MTVASERLLKRRQRDVDDRRVDERHARAEDRGDEDPAGMRGHHAIGAPSVAFEFFGTVHQRVAFRQSIPTMP